MVKDLAKKIDEYWVRRSEKAQAAITAKNTKQLEKQLAKYYSSTMNGVINDFTLLLEKLEKQKAEGKNITPADLYKLDKYWKLQAQSRKELEKLGEKQLAALGKTFESSFMEVYEALEIDGMPTFTTLDRQGVQQMINQIWVADGKTYSQRVWKNVEKLISTLNDELIHCVAAGKSPKDLKQMLKRRFEVSYSQADTLIRTELCHIQTQAAQKRYEDYGIKYVEVLVDADACEKCQKLKGQKWLTTAVPPLPVHPNERCCLVPIIE